MEFLSTELSQLYRVLTNKTRIKWQSNQTWWNVDPGSLYDQHLSSTSGNILDNLDGVEIPLVLQFKMIFSNGHIAREIMTKFTNICPPFICNFHTIIMCLPKKEARGDWGGDSYDCYLFQILTSAMFPVFFSLPRNRGSMKTRSDMGTGIATCCICQIPLFADSHHCFNAANCRKYLAELILP